MIKSVILLATGLHCLGVCPAGAQTVLPAGKFKNLYGEAGFGAGKTIITGPTKGHVAAALGGAFEPVVAGNFTTAFYYAPEKWRGLGLGTRLMWSGGPGAVGENGADYFFNYYNFSVSAKYYPLTQQFNHGFYLRAALGTGQLTTKRANDIAKSYTHQFAIGGTATGNIGYSFPLLKNAGSLEAHFEISSRRGTINGLGNRLFKSGQAGLNFIYSF